jgi:hypothetical protein
MIVHVVGRLGAGKTLFAVSKIISALLFTDKLVVTNIRLVDYWDKLLAYRQVRGLLGFIKFLLSPFSDLRSYCLFRASEFSSRYIYFPDFAPAIQYCFSLSPISEGSRLFIWDEVHLDLNARAWKSQSLDIIKFFSMSRKLGFDILIISQLQGAVDRQLRELADISYMLKNLKWLRIFGNTGLLVKRWANKGFDAGGSSVFLGAGVVRYSNSDISFYDTKQLLTEKDVKSPLLWSQVCSGGVCSPCVYFRFYLRYSGFVMKYYKGWASNSVDSASRPLSLRLNQHLSGVDRRSRSAPDR